MTAREFSKEHNKLIGRQTFPHLMQRIGIERMLYSVLCTVRPAARKVCGTGGAFAEAQPITKHRETCEMAVMMRKACDLHL